MDYIETLTNFGSTLFLPTILILIYKIKEVGDLKQIINNISITDDICNVAPDTITENKEIKSLRIENENLTTEITNLKNQLSNLKEKEEDLGQGPIRYKSEDSLLYYHGIGHLEQKYVWWESNKNHCIIEYKNKNQIKYPQWETDNIHIFCSNCVPSTILNKGKRKKIYYICQGHKQSNHT
tara:strand:- start:170 stop:712 length:543 start_codon:yes stop_codon:yes gene_type:complete